MKEKKSNSNTRTPKKINVFLKSHPWQSAVAALLVVVMVVLAIGTQIIQVRLSADSYDSQTKQKAAEYLSDANSYINLGNFDRAMESIRLFFDRYPDDEEGYLYRASIYTGKGEYQKAVSDMNHAIKLNPSNSDYYLQRGCLFILLDNYKDAGKDFDKSIDTSNNDATTLLLVAQIYLEQKNYDKSLKVYDRYLAAFPDSAEIYAQEAYI